MRVRSPGKRLRKRRLKFWMPSAVAGIRGRAGAGAAHARRSAASPDRTRECSRPRRRTDRCDTARAAHRVQVDDRAAHGELARRHHPRARDVAGAARPIERPDVEHFADAEIESVGIDVRLRRQALQRRFEIDDDNALGEARQRRQHPQALRHDVRMRREQVVGVSQAVEMLDVAAGRAEESQLVFHAARMARVRGAMTSRARRLARSLGQPQRWLSRTAGPSARAAGPAGQQVDRRRSNRVQKHSNDARGRPRRAWCCSGRLRSKAEGRRLRVRAGRLVSPV